MSKIESDKKSLDEKTVLVGLCGDLESAVSAYLLKKQGFNVIGIGVMFGPKEEDEPVAAKPVPTKNKAKSGEEAEEELSPRPAFIGEYLIDNILNVKTVADRLDIKFYGVYAQEIYQAYVTDSLVAARLGGSWHEPKVDATYVLLRVLMEKADKLGAKWIASGHYAKVIKNHHTGDYNIFTANDLERDDSYLLSKLDTEIMSRLILPLSETRRTEVEKIGNVIGLKEAPRPTKPHLMKSPDLAKMVELNSPKKMKKEGSFFYHKEESIVGDHNSYYDYFLGQDKLINKNGLPLNKDLMVVEVKPQIGLVVLSLLSEMKRRFLSIRDIQIEDHVDVSKPFDAFVKLGPDDERTKVMVFMKNNKSCLLDFDKDLAGVTYPGQRAVIYSKRGLGGKILFSGVVGKSGWEEDGKLNFLPKSNSEILEESVKGKTEKKGSTFDLKF